MNMIIIFASGIVANIIGWATPILALANFVWFLVKDETLFSWWVVIYMIIAFLAAVGVGLIAIVTKD